MMARKLKDALTEAWLAAVGGKKMNITGSRLFIGPEAEDGFNTLLIDVSFTKGVPFTAISLHDGKHEHRYYKVQPKTRAEFRRLCEVLGVELEDG